MNNLKIGDTFYYWSIPLLGNPSVPVLANMIIKKSVVKDFIDDYDFRIVISDNKEMHYLRDCYFTSQEAITGLLMVLSNQLAKLNTPS